MEGGRVCRGWGLAATWAQGVDGFGGVDQHRGHGRGGPSQGGMELMSAPGGLKLVKVMIPDKVFMSF